MQDSSKDCWQARSAQNSIAQDLWHLEVACVGQNCLPNLVQKYVSALLQMKTPFLKQILYNPSQWKFHQLRQNGKNKNQEYSREIKNYVLFELMNGA